MSVITEHEQEQIQRANDAGHTPVVFVHGLWLLPSSWARWRDLFEAAGYTTLAPGWPDDPDTVEEANEHPEVFAHKTVGEVADHFGNVITNLTWIGYQDDAADVVATKKTYGPYSLDDARRSGKKYAMVNLSDLAKNA